MTLRYLTMNQLSEQTGIDRRTVKKRLQGLKVHKGAGKGHYYDCVEALPALYRPDSKSDMEKRLQEETLNYERARAQKLQIQVDTLKGILVHIEEVAKVIEKEYSFVKSQFRSIPSKLAKPLSMITDPLEVHSILMESVDECLSELTADLKYEEQRIRTEERLALEELSVDESAGDSTAEESEADTSSASET